MSEGSVVGKKFKELYKAWCQEEWNPYLVGVLIAFFSVMMLAWSRPWGAVGAIRNWGEWIFYGLGMNPMEMFGEDFDAPGSIWTNSGSVIGIGFVAGAFLSACLGNQFALRFPPLRELAKAVIAGLLMGVGAALAGGCNVGGFYNAIGNLSAHGFAMMAGLVLGAVTGLKLLYLEMEHLSWGSGGAKTIEFPSAVQLILGILALAALVFGAYNYAGSDDDSLVKMGGVLLIAAALGYSMQRGRWCMIQGFREPHMTGDCTLAKSVALSVLLVALGGVVIKGAGLADVAHYVRGTFGWGGVIGGFVFGLGAMFAGGCGTGTLWRVGEGQIKLWLVVPFFGISNALMTTWFRSMGDDGLEGYFEEGEIVSGGLGKFVYLPETFLGYGGTLALITLAMMAWYLVVKWNEDSNKLIVPM
jgi:hypothetical protein